jgi:hypothetical protein
LNLRAWLWPCFLLKGVELVVLGCKPVKVTAWFLHPAPAVMSAGNFDTGCRVLAMQPVRNKSDSPSRFCRHEEAGSGYLAG